MTLMILPGLAAAEETPKPADVLFEARHLDLIENGKQVTYHFEKKVSDENLLGKPYQDDISVGVTKTNDKGERDVVFKVFTGEMARDPASWPELTINPILVWYLDRCVNTFTSLAGGNHMYLKARFRDALRDKAEIEPIKADYAGKSVDAYRIKVSPFADDPNTSKMQGYQNSKFAIVVSKDVPGYFIDMSSEFTSNVAAAPRLEEHLSLTGLGESK